MVDRLIIVYEEDKDSSSTDKKKDNKNNKESIKEISVESKKRVIQSRTIRSGELRRDERKIKGIKKKFGRSLLLSVLLRHFEGARISKIVPLRFLLGKKKEHLLLLKFNDMG